ncbi:MAG: hypothetical protein MJ252_21645, partial [archaeon]|nr:hypothetical protein [archaeon]
YSKKKIKFYVGFWEKGKQSGLGKTIKSTGESYGFYYQGKTIKTYTKKQFQHEIEKMKSNEINLYSKFFNIDLEKALSIMQ